MKLPLLSAFAVPIVGFVCSGTLPLCAASDSASVSAQNSAPAGFAFAEATIDDLQARMAAGTLTAHELTAAYLRRIAEIDHAGPHLNALLEVNPDALAIADQLDAERKAGKVRGPLHGIPVLIKDNIATADRMETTAGSLALLGAKPPRDAFVVEQLRKAGAVILGKTNLSEWANFRGERSVSGWSGRGGQTHNPYVLDRSPVGSSSGSAVAVAANLCVAAIGTETSGSIIAPASACGVVGLKPTVGRVSRAGIIPIAASFDTAGPITRTVRDAALMLAALAASDSRDPATAQQPSGQSADFAATLAPDALRGARIGLVRDATFRPNLDGALDAAVQTLRAAGAEVVEIKPVPPKLRPVVLEVMLYEIKDGMNAYLASLGPDSPMKSLADLIRFNEEHWAEEMPLFGQQFFERAQAKGPLTDQAYLDARAQCWQMARTNGIDAMMDQDHLDALVAIAFAPAGLITPGPKGDPVFGAKGPSGAGYQIAAAAGYPSVTVPLTQVSGLPVGLLFYGRAWTEGKILGYAEAFQARTHARKIPEFRPTLSADDGQPVATP